MERVIVSNRIEQEVREKSVRIFMEKCPISHPDLISITLGGSTSEGSGGKRSDIDITTVLNPENPIKIDLDAIILIGQQLKESLNDLMVPGVIQPIVISTIRLEDAQIAMSDLMGTPALPIHWLHYPSLEFAKVNEPAELVKGLLANGKSIFGDQRAVIDRFDKIDVQYFKFLSGLDWLTDSFKILIANSALGQCDSDSQPKNFLFGLATHNLEYFWKWRIIAPIITAKTGETIKGWKEAETFSGLVDPFIWKVAGEVRRIRHQSPNIDLGDIVKLHKLTFQLWPL